jgi:hypothetical protein
MLWNLGAPIHCFGQLVRAIFLRSSLINDCECSELRIIEAHYASRPDDLWGRPEKGGTFRKRSHALAHAHSLTFELDFKKNKSGLRKTISDLPTSSRQVMTRSTKPQMVGTTPSTCAKATRRLTSPCSSMRTGTCSYSTATETTSPFTTRELPAAMLSSMSRSAIAPSGILAASRSKLTARAAGKH